MLISDVENARDSGCKNTKKIAENGKLDAITLRNAH